jgi:hypothetical protein
MRECNLCGEPDADELVDPWGIAHGYQCEACSEAIWEDQQGDCYRGHEAATHAAERQAEIQRTLK